MLLNYLVSYVAFLKSQLVLDSYGSVGSAWTWANPLSEETHPELSISSVFS
jgi:hypothetical protein